MSGALMITKSFKFFVVSLTLFITIINAFTIICLGTSSPHHYYLFIKYISTNPITAIQILNVLKSSKSNTTVMFQVINAKRLIVFLYLYPISSCKYIVNLTIVLLNAYTKVYVLRSYGGGRTIACYFGVLPLPSFSETQLNLVNTSRGPRRISLHTSFAVNTCSRSPLVNGSNISTLWILTPYELKHNKVVFLNNTIKGASCTYIDEIEYVRLKELQHLLGSKIKNISTWNNLRKILSNRTALIHAKPLVRVNAVDAYYDPVYGVPLIINLTSYIPKNSVNIQKLCLIDGALLKGLRIASICSYNQISSNYLIAVKIIENLNMRTVRVSYKLNPLYLLIIALAIISSAMVLVHQRRSRR